MSENIKFSIIIPIYNAQEFILDTLSSISIQSYKNFEVILIDDGSTDKTNSIISNYIKTNKKFKLLHQKNSGPNVSRNHAINNSTGEYILFLDSDDTFKYNLLSILYSELSYKKYDIINFGYEFKNFLTKKIISKSKYQRNELHKERALESAFKSGGISGVCWNKCIRRNLILNNNIYFIPDRMHGRDILFSRTCIYYADSVLIIPNILITSRFRKGSYSRNFNKNNILSAIDLVEMHKIFFDKKISKVQMNNLDIAMYRHLRYIHILNAFRAKDISEYKYNFNLLSKYSNTILPPQSKPQIGLKFKIIDNLLKHPFLFRSICIFLKKFGLQPY